MENLHKKVLPFFQKNYQKISNKTLFKWKFVEF